jgi:plasmid rolling circle replication initiator protein Rep
MVSTINIIANGCQNVNIKQNNVDDFGDNVDSLCNNVSINISINIGKNEEPTENLSKWEKYKRMSANVSEKMIKMGYVSRGYRMRDCGNFIQYKHCADCGTFFVEKTNLCRDRFCPVCNWRLSLQRFVQMREVFQYIYEQYPTATYSMITLTVQNCKPSELGNTLTDMCNAWHKITCSRKFKDMVNGTARTIEITYNEKSKTFHPHFHVIMMWKGDIGSEDYIINRWLNLVRGEGHVADIKGQEGHTLYERDNGILGAILETFKYSVKNDDLNDLPLYAFHELIEGTRGRRFVSLTGIIKNVASALKVNTETVEGEEQTITVCKACGSIDLDVMLYKWSFGNTYKRVF